MNSLCEDVSQISTIPEIVETKLKRRSSIFRLDASEASVQLTNCTIYQYPPNYEQLLTKEVHEWKEMVHNVKQECLKLKEESNKPVDKIEYYPTISDYNEFLKEADDFFGQVELMVKVQEHLIKYRNIKKMELEKLMEATGKSISQSVNL